MAGVTAEGVARVAEFTKVAGPVIKDAAKVAVGIGVTYTGKLGMDKVQEAYSKASYASDSDSARHDPYGTVPSTSPITGIGPSILTPDAAETIRSTNNHGSQSAHSFHSATATKTQTWAPNIKVTGQGVRIEFPGSAWPLALAAVGIYAVGSWLFSSSKSTSGAKTTSGDKSATLLRQKSPSSAPRSCRAAASGNNATGGAGGNGSSSSSDKGKGERGKEKRTKDQLLPFRDTRLAK